MDSESSTDFKKKLNESEWIGGKFSPRDGKFKPVEWLMESWEIIKADPVDILVFSLVYMVVAIVMICTIVGALAIYGLMAGYMLVLIGYLRRKEPLDIRKMITSGWDYFLNLFVYLLVGGILSSIGALLLIIPGLIIGMAFYIGMFLIIDKKANYTEALKATFALIVNKPVDLLVFYLIFAAIGLVLGIICIIPFLGWAVYIAAIFVLPPLTYIAYYKAYMEFFGDA